MGRGGVCLFSWWFDGVVFFFSGCLCLSFLFLLGCVRNLAVSFSIPFDQKFGVFLWYLSYIVGLFSQYLVFVVESFIVTGSVIP